MNRKKQTQEDRILRHLQDYKFITSMDAFKEYGTTRLSAVIFNLRKKGYKINTEYTTANNRYGEAVTFGKYILITPF